MKLLYFYLVVAAAFILVGCEDDDSSSSSSHVDTAQRQQEQAAGNEEQDIISFSGTLSYKDFEGGFFAIDADDGTGYHPINLPKEFAVNGLRVNVTARIRDDLASIHMYGTMIDIVEISIL